MDHCNIEIVFKYILNKCLMVVFIEKIFVGERIRDIIYNSSLNAFILAMEDTGSIGLFTPVKNDG